MRRLNTAGDAPPWLAPVVHPQAQESTAKEEDGGQEGKGLGGLPFGAWRVVEANVAPAESAATVDIANPVKENSKCSKPSSREQNVHGHMKHVANGWEHPYQGQEGWEDGDDKSVDFARARWATKVDEVGDQAHDHHAADELCEAQAKREETWEKHSDGREVECYY